MVSNICSFTMIFEVTFLVVYLKKLELFSVNYSLFLSFPFICSILVYLLLFMRYLHLLLTPWISFYFQFYFIHPSSSLMD